GVINKRSGYTFFGQLVHYQTDLVSITNANPGQVTVTSAAGLTEGQEVQISYATGLTALNGRRVVITNLVANTFDLYDLDGNPINTSAMGVYAGNGVLC